MRIFLIRHGECSKVNGDNILTKKGVKQSKHVALKLSKFPLDLVFTSNLTRAKQTAEEYSKLNPHKDVKIREELNEIYRTIIGGPEREGTRAERKQEDIIRVESFFNEITHLKEKNIALFTHGNLIRYYLSKILKISPESMWGKLVISPGSISVIEIDNNNFQIKAINILDHQGKKDVNDFYSEEINFENYID